METSNSSSEIYFFTKHIAQDYCLPTEIKHQLLTTYIALTTDERNSSHQYNELIDTSDFMNLNKNNKCHIQRLFSTQTIMQTHDINNNKKIILGDFPEAQIDYQKMLTLPLKVRRKIAHEYSPMILVKATEEDLDQEEAKDEEGLELGISLIAGAIIGIILDNYFITISGYSWIIPSIILSPTTKIIYDKCRPLTSNQAFKYYYYNGYTLLPLLPEDKK